MKSKLPSRERMSELVPNTFPFPNFIIDVQEIETQPNTVFESNVWALLTGEEQNLLAITYRKTFGWWKRSDQISISQLMKMSGLNDNTVRKYMRTLEEIGLVSSVRAIETNHNNYGNEYAPQTNDALINWDFLIDRWQRKVDANIRRGAKSSENLKKAGTPVAQDAPPPVAQDAPPPVAQETQLTLSKSNKSKSTKGAPRVSKKLNPNEFLQSPKWGHKLQALGDCYTSLIRCPMRSEFVFWRKGLQELHALGATPDALQKAIVIAKREWADKIKSPLSFKTSVQKFIVKGNENGNENFKSSESADEAAGAAARAALAQRAHA